MISVALPSPYLEALLVEASECAISTLFGLDHSNAKVGGGAIAIVALSNVRLQPVLLMRHKQLFTWTRNERRGCLSGRNWGIRALLGRNSEVELQLLLSSKKQADLKIKDEAKMCTYPQTQSGGQCQPQCAPCSPGRRHPCSI